MQRSMCPVISCVNVSVIVCHTSYAAGQLFMEQPIHVKHCHGLCIQRKERGDYWLAVMTVAGCVLPQKHYNYYFLPPPAVYIHSVHMY